MDHFSSFLQQRVVYPLAQNLWSRNSSLFLCTLPAMIHQQCGRQVEAYIATWAQSCMMTGWCGRYVTQEVKARRRSRTVANVVQEHYIRDDIPCGTSLCSTCTQQSPELERYFVSHYMIPDCDTILAFLEVLEIPAVAGIIFLSSVVQKVAEQGGIKAYTRVRALISDPRKHSIHFDDQHFLFTRLMLEDNLRASEVTREVQIVKDKCAFGITKRREREEAAIQVAATWYVSHLKDSGVPIVVVSDGINKKTNGEINEVFDSLSLEGSKAANSDDSEGKSQFNFQVMTSAEYFSQFWGHEKQLLLLYESLCLMKQEQSISLAGNEDKSLFPVGRKNEKEAFKPHLSEAAVDEGVRNGTIRLGNFFVSRKSSAEAFVKPSVSGPLISISSRRLQNRAIHGDFVAVNIFPRRKIGFRAAAGADVDDGEGEGGGEAEAEKEEEEEEGEEVEEEVEAEASGEVVRIMHRPPRDYAASLREEDEGQVARRDSSRQEAVLCVPMDRRIPMIRLLTRHADVIARQRFVVRIDGWDRASRLPSGHVVRRIGPIGELRSEAAALLVEHGVQESPFSQGALRELPEDSPERPWKVPEPELRSRRDLRQAHFTCSIDPPGSRDVDDALSVQWEPGTGLLQVGVHIADVAYFVPAGRHLDVEAAARGTTVYLVDRRMDMLPPVLSERVCSLLGGVDRLAVSCIWTVDLSSPSATVVHTWLGRTVIHSSHQLAYEQAQRIHDGQPLPATWRVAGGAAEEQRIRDALRALVAVAQSWRGQRVRNGALELHSSELRFEVNQATERPEKVNTKDEIAMTSVVAELMIAANATVAEKLVKCFPTQALLRRHPSPQKDALQPLLQVKKTKNALTNAWSKELEADPTKDKRLDVPHTRGTCFNTVLSSCGVCLAVL